MKRTLQPSASGKRPFNIGEAVRLLRKVTAPYPKAALFELYAEGYTSVFEILVACIVSIRTRDEVTLPVSRRLFTEARTPAAVAALTPARVEELIRPCMYPEVKAPRIHAIAERAVAEFGGELPCDDAVLLSLPGVGPKCAGLALGIACQLPFIGVDVHVHRVTNRWGLVSAKSPVKTMTALKAVLPRRYWVEINALLVPFGKHVCTGVRPKCSNCPLLSMCRQVGVSEHR
jgi:endonuclease-3